VLFDPVETAIVNELAFTYEILWPLTELTFALSVASEFANPEMITESPVFNPCAVQLSVVGLPFALAEVKSRAMRDPDAARMKAPILVSWMS